MVLPSRVSQELGTTVCGSSSNHGLTLENERRLILSLSVGTHARIPEAACVRPPMKKPPVSGGTPPVDQDQRRLLRRARLLGQCRIGGARPVGLVPVRTHDVAGLGHLAAGQAGRSKAVCTGDFHRADLGFLAARLMPVSGRSGLRPCSSARAIAHLHRAGTQIQINAWPWP